MKDMEREKFEGSWKNAFENAEVAPSDKVWANIELDLEKAKGGDLRRRLFFYQMLAAASVVFAMAIGGIGYYYSFRMDQREAGILAQQASSSESNHRQNADNTASESNNNAPRESGHATLDDTESTSANEAINGATPRASADKHQERPSGSNDDEAIRRVENYNPLPNGPSSFDGSTPVVQVKQQSFEHLLPLAIEDRELAPLHSPGPVRLNFDKKTEAVDPVVAMMARLAQREQEVQDEGSRKDEEASSNENLWTSIGFAAGSFNAVQGSSATPSSPSAALASFAAPIVDQEAQATGYSYSMGINVGTRLSERWVLQGGVNYLTQASEYTSNNIVMDAPGYFTQQKFRAASTNELMMIDASDLHQKLLYSAPYSVNNSMRYLSIPMQAGYLLINKTFGLQLNAGVATDLFLQNTISAESDRIAKTSQPVGEDSPYRAVNLSGLFGTEVSYRFGEHYRVSLNPGIRYPFNTIYKSELGVQSTPLTFDVGLRFRYIFR